MVAPAGNAAMVLLALLPLTLTDPQLAPPVGKPQDAITPVTAAGTLSAKTVPAAASGPALLTVMVYMMVEEDATEVGPALLIETFATGLTVNMALVAAAFEPTLVVRAPEAIVLVYVPAVGAVTSIWKVHEPPAGTVPPVSVTLAGVDVTVPPAQLVEVLGLVARSKPVPGETGKESVMPVTKIEPAFGLVIVIVNVVVPPELIVAGENDLAMVGAAAVTVNVAVFDTAPVAASLLETPLVLFGNMPGVLLITMIDTVQLPLAGIVRPAKESNPPWLAVKALPDAPVHVPPAAPVALMNMPARVSLKAAPVRAMPLLLAIVKSICDVPPSEMVLGVNDLAMVGTTDVTVNVAVLEAAPMAASLLDTPELVFGFIPGTLLVTTMVTVQLPPAGIVSEEKLMVPVWLLVKELPVAPVQVPPANWPPPILILLNASVNDAPVNAIELGLVIVNVTVEVPLAAIVDGEKFLAMVGVAVVTVTQLATSPVTLIFAVPPILAALLVNAAGLDAQLAFTCPEVFLTCTSITQDACADGIVAPVTVMVPLPLAAVVTPAALVHVDDPSTPPAATLMPVGKVSVKPIPLCAGLEPVLVIVKRSVVVPPSIKVPGVNTLVNSGGVVLTTRHWLVTPLMIFAAPAMLPLALVKAAGLVTQLALTCAARLVTLETVTVHAAVPAFIVIPLKAIVSGVP
jgi:hypothetical protein